MVDLAVSAETYFSVHTAEEHHALIRAWATANGVDAETLGAPEDVDVGADPAVARLEHWRWIADCPNPACTAAGMLRREQAAFMCGECFNDDIAFAYRPVEWPAEALEIEAVVRERRNRKNRHWFPGETLEELRAENEELEGEG